MAAKRFITNLMDIDTRNNRYMASVGITMQFCDVLARSVNMLANLWNELRSRHYISPDHAWRAALVRRRI
jgi:hypothetical protein